MEFESIVDLTWNCGCGALNSPALTTCGGCNIEKE
jgi:hypothetical protein|tara:strand:- start:2510 stop:2614 length:105 start_codon:yes stop_codon:yes gene_type:complete